MEKMMTANATCDVYWDSYLKIEYQEVCDYSALADPHQIDTVKFWASIVLSFIGAVFNLWALILLIVDFQMPHRSHHVSKLNSQVSSSTGPHMKASVGVSKKSTMHVGLMIFCFCEVFYHVTQASGESIRLHAWSGLQSNTITHPTAGQLPIQFSHLPIVAAIFDWLRDAGICCRNWAITLITIARAEVVVWPLAAHIYQRCLRKKRVFVTIFGLLTAFSLLMSGLRRLDSKVSVCYSIQLASYCTSDEPFLVDLTEMTSFYFSYQTLVPWLLIFVFTTLIIVKLHPCATRTEENFIHRHQPPAKRAIKMGGSRDSHVRASVAVTVLAAFFTVFELPTFVLCVYYLAVDPNADLVGWSTAATILLQVDSIANFFLLILTMPSLRRHLCGKLHPRGPRSFFSQSEGIKLGETEVISNV